MRWAVLSGVLAGLLAANLAVGGWPRPVWERDVPYMLCLKPGVTWERYDALYLREHGRLPRKLVHSAAAFDAAVACCVAWLLAWAAGRVADAATPPQTAGTAPPAAGTAPGRA